MITRPAAAMSIDPVLELVTASRPSYFGGCDLEVPVALCVDGRSYIVGLRPDLGEHLRRREMDLGAVTSTGLLHALWELPYGIPLPPQALRPMDCVTLEHEGSGWVEERDDGLVRTYQPAGIVRSVAVSDRSLIRAVHKAATHRPTIRRTAIWLRPTGGNPPAAEASLLRAASLGVGVLAVGGGHVSELVRPADAISGRPAVFRWWQAELAYRNWLRSTEPTD